MCKLFEEWKDDIKSYCDENNLDFEKAKKLSKSWNKTSIVLYYYKKENIGNGPFIDTPCPAVLLIQREKDGKFTFEQTEYTDIYLKKIS